MEARDAAGLTDATVIRIEQIYPFPGEALAVRLKRMPKLEEVVWAQEEPRNNGAWFFVNELIEESLTEAGKKDMRPRYAGRAAAASPATGLMSRHQNEPSALVADATGISVRAAIRSDEPTSEHQ